MNDINPVTGERYNKDFWSSELARVTNPAKKAWRDAMGVMTEDEYLEKGNLKSLVVANDYVKPKRGDELEQKYVQVSNAIKNGSWRAIYAENDAEFDRILREMTNQAKAFGYDECVKWDQEQGEKRAAAVRRALGK